MTKWQKNLGAKKWIRENCTPLFRTAIFLPFYFFAFLLVAAEGRAGYFVVILRRTTMKTVQPWRICKVHEQLRARNWPNDAPQPQQVGRDDNDSGN